MPINAFYTIQLYRGAMKQRRSPDLAVPPRQFSKKHDKNCGFTLIELSIALVVIALLIAGIVLARDMIRIAQIRKVMTQVESFKTAINTFKGKYNGLPGDLPTAYNFFGPTCGAPAGTIAATGGPAWCNGNGNSSMADDGSTSLLAWRHLSDSGLIKENMIGGSGTGFDYDNRVLNVNVPASIDTGYFTFANNTIRIVSGNFLILQSPDLTANIATNWEIISSLEAYSIDSKMDDGQPNTGSVMGLNGQLLTGTPSPLHSGQFCAPNSYGGNYFLGTEKTCYMVFYIGNN